MFKKILILAFLFAASCSGKLSQKESPVIYFSNSSAAPIKDIEFNWVGKNKLSLPLLNPGESRSESFYISGESEFFGLINVSWSNDRGEAVNREFFFNKNNLPSFADVTTYNYVQFYLDQDEFEITTSDAPDLAGKTRKMDRILTEYRQNYLQGHRVVQSALIRVQPQRDNSVPTWISTSY